MKLAVTSRLSYAMVNCPPSSYCPLSSSFAPTLTLFLSRHFPHLASSYHTGFSPTSLIVPFKSFLALSFLSSEYRSPSPVYHNVITLHPDLSTLLPNLYLINNYVSMLLPNLPWICHYLPSTAAVLIHTLIPSLDYYEYNGLLVGFLGMGIYNCPSSPLL